MTRIGIVALSSPVPPVEFSIGVDFLRAAGLDVLVHPNVLARHWLHAGDDEARAHALLDVALDPTIDVVWCARGGYGAAKLLPILDRAVVDRGKPPACKMLVGYSDVTVLHEYVRERWDWRTLHAAMPAAASFTSMKPHDWNATLAAVRGEAGIDWPWAADRLRWLTPPPAEPIEAPIIGGNLALWQTLIGTPYAPRGRHMLFLEDLGEPFYRIDRMMTHLEQSDILNDCAAIVLGDFADCKDENNTCLVAAGSSERQPLRPTFSFDDLLKNVFATIGIRRKFPVAVGFPAGHGQNYAPIPLGESFVLDVTGRVSLSGATAI